MYEHVPAELKCLRQWVGFTMPDKKPKNPRTGGNAMPNTASTWGSFDEACAAMEKFGFAGIGFVIMPPYIGIDMDHCLDDVEFIDEFVSELRTYAEYSPSGQGIHFIGKGSVNLTSNKKSNLEMYDHCHYFTVTGNIMPGAELEIEDIAEPAQRLHDKYMSAAPVKIAENKFTGNTNVILHKASTAKNSALFNDLFAGKWETIANENGVTRYKSQSEADLALCNMLAYWTNCDMSAMDTIFNLSELAKRSKWNSSRGSRTYGEMTILKAIEGYGVFKGQLKPGDFEAVPAPSDVETASSPPLPRVKGWRVDEARGIYHMNKDGEWVHAFPHPIKPIAILVNADDHMEGLRIAFKQCDETEWREVTCDRATAASDKKIVILANSGVNVTTSTGKVLVAYLSACIPFVPRKLCLARLGWIEGKFAPYDSEIELDIKEAGKLVSAVHKRGDAAPWVKLMAQLRQEQLVFRLMMAGGFASPLIGLLGAQCFMMHTWGGTGTGKTFAMRCAASAWGNSERGELVRTLNSTDNAFMQNIAALHSITHFADELQLVKVKGAHANYDETIMKVTQGEGRARMEFNKVVPTKTWECATMTTGEEPLIQPGSGGGAANRVIEIHVTERILNYKLPINAVIDNNYGHAGETFVRGLQSEGLTGLLARYKAICAEIMATAETMDKQANAVALVMLADELSEKYVFKSGLAPLAVSDISHIIANAHEISVSDRAYEIMCSWVNTNQGGFYRNGCAPASTNVRIIGMLWDGHDKACISKEPLRVFLAENGYSLKSVLPEWCKSGYVERVGYDEYAVNKRIGGTQTKCILVKLPQE